MQPDFTKLKPVPSTNGSTPYFDNLNPVPSTVQDTKPIKNDSFLSGIDNQLSDMPGVLGFIGSGIYNAGKGLAQLGGAAVADTFQAVNHPIDSGKAIADFLGGELNGGQAPEKLDTLGRFVQSTVGSKGILGIGQDAIALENAGIDKLYGAVTGQKPQKEIKPVLQNGKEVTAGKVGGDLLNTALTVMTFGSGNVAARAIEKSVEKGLITTTVGNALKPIATSLAGRSLQSGGIMAGFQLGSNLKEGQPLDTGIKQAFGAGLALPGLIQTTGKVLSKIIPSDTTSEAGAEQLRKTIGFRGTNPKEINQFKQAVPIVYDLVKQSGFNPERTDPNNLINLDKVVQDNMTKILQDRTARIQATGGDAMISGSLAADKIRNLVEPGSVEDLINPATREKLDVVANNFEGKKYNPIDAQRAIVQANSGFSFSDNPAMASKIKMAISEAFTPELDRIVAGTDQVKYDIKGKPIAQSGGTAELNKKWSALKTFQDQLVKKINIEDRKANFNLPDRLTSAQIAGEIGGAIASPKDTLFSYGKAGAMWIANKIMGDRNNVNYRIYKAFNGSPIGLNLVNLLNKFTKAEDIAKLLEQNLLIQNLIEKIYSADPTLKATAFEPKTKIKANKK